jgi:hypothetical protein
MRMGADLVALAGDWIQQHQVRVGGRTEAARRMRYRISNVVRKLVDGRSLRAQVKMWEQELLGQGPPPIPPLPRLNEFRCSTFTVTLTDGRTYVLMALMEWDQSTPVCLHVRLNSEPSLFGDN